MGTKPTHSTPLTATVITNLAALVGLQSAWQTLTEQLDGQLDFFTSYSWTYAYLEHYRPPDWLVVAIFNQDSQQLRAVFPLQRFRLNHGAQQFSACKPLGVPYLPYIDFPVQSQDRRELISALLNDVLRLQLHIDLVFFWPLHEDSKLYLTLVEDLGGQPVLKTDRYPHNLHHVDGRSQRFQDYTKTRPGHTFKDAAYCQRRLAREGQVSWAVHTDPQALGTTVQQLCAWNQAQFNSQHVHAKLTDWPEFMAQLACQLVPLGYAELTTLYLDGKAIAAALSFIHKKRRNFYLMGHDPRFKIFSPCKILISHLIEKTFQEGGIFCMGAGNYAYKRDWTPHVGEVKSAIVFLNPQARSVLEPHLGKADINRITGF